MSVKLYMIATAIAGILALSTPTLGQNPTSAKPHTIVVNLVVTGGSKPYAFEPSNITVQRGDTVRFVNTVAVMHNVHFKTHPSDSKLGSITTGPYLITKGQIYNVIIDKRFTDGTYTFVCDPHELLGMHGTFIVAGNSL